MARSTRTEAEERYAKAQKRAKDAAKAMTEAEVEAKRIDDNTARLRALRLAKEAARKPPRRRQVPPRSPRPEPRR